MSADPNWGRLLAAYHAMARRHFAAEAARLGGDAETLRRDALSRLTGRRSAADCTADDLDAAIRELRGQGANDGRARGGDGDGTSRPTKAQWARIGALARSRGWSAGLEDPRLTAFASHTTGATSVRWLTRAQASAIITGLERWATQAPGRAAG